MAAFQATALTVKHFQKDHSEDALPTNTCPSVTDVFSGGGIQVGGVSQSLTEFFSRVSPRVSANTRANHGLGSRFGAGPDSLANFFYFFKPQTERQRRSSEAAVCLVTSGWREATTIIILIIIITHTHMYLCGCVCAFTVVAIDTQTHTDLCRKQ